MILITGASGFVGKALMNDLQTRGETFRPVSRNHQPGFVAIGPMNAHTDWRAALDGITEIVHLAARTHVTRERDVDPLAAYHQINVAATLRLARQAADAGVRRFVFVSSIKVNGESTPPGQPFRASDVPAPQDPYGMTKHEAEQGLTAIGRETGMDIVIIRPPLVYGPGVKANFASMMMLIRRRIPLPFGSVRNERSLVFVQNLTDLIITCIRHPKAANGVFLVSDIERPSIAALMTKLANSMGLRALLLPVPPALLNLALRALGKADVAQRLLGSLTVDIDETVEHLGWRPPFSLDEGLRLTARSRLGARKPLA